MSMLSMNESSLETDRKVQNMVATTDVGFPIRLEGMVAAQSVKWCNYEPELFPGLIYRLNKPCKVCFLVFVSGKVRTYVGMRHLSMRNKRPDTEGRTTTRT